MKRLSLLGLALGVGLASPALALKHEVVIAHPDGAIAAEYAGTVTVETRQVGNPGPGGRHSTLSCRWSAALTLERSAQVGEGLRSRRQMRSDNVVTGSAPGWCRNNTKVIDQLVEARRETFRAAMLDLVAQDRSALLAEAGSTDVAERDS